MGDGEVTTCQGALFQVERTTRDLLIGGEKKHAGFKQAEHLVWLQHRRNLGRRTVDRGSRNLGTA